MDPKPRSQLLPLPKCVTKFHQQSFNNSLNNFDSTTSLKTWNSTSRAYSNTNSMDCCQRAASRPVNERASLLRRQCTNCENASSIYFQSTMENLTMSLVNNVLITDVRSGIGWLSVVFGLANATIGVGALTYPSAYDKLGGPLLATIVQLAVVTVLFISIFILILSADVTNSENYQEVLSKIYGKKAEILVAGDILLATFGACVAYLMVIGDQFDRIFASIYGDDFCHHWYMRREFTMITAALLISPLCYLKNLNFMRHTAPLGIISMLYVVFLTIYQHCTLTDIHAGPIKTQPSNAIAFIATIPVICFSYQANEVVIPIYASMKVRSAKVFLRSAFLSYVCTIFLYGLVGYFGYTTFGSGVSSDIMLMFNANDPIVLIGVIALIIKMALTFPQMSFVNRGALDCLYVLLFKSDDEDLEKHKIIRHYVESTAIFTSAVWLAISVPDIGIVIQSLGALSAANAFILPSICLISILATRKFEKNIKIRVILITLGILLIIVGVAFIALVIYQVKIELDSPAHHPLCHF